MRLLNNMLVSVTWSFCARCLYSVCVLVSRNKATSKSSKLWVTSRPISLRSAFVI